MVQKINTGNFRICRHKEGIANSIQILKVGDRDSIAESWRIKEIDPMFSYYCEEEVIYRGSQFDKDGNPIDSSPGWVRY